MLSEPLLFQPPLRDFLKWWLLALPDHQSQLQHLRRAIDWITDAHVAQLYPSRRGKHLNGPTCRHPDDMAPCAGCEGSCLSAKDTE